MDYSGKTKIKIGILTPMKNLTIKTLLKAEDLTIGYSDRGKNIQLQSGLNIDLFEGDFICLIGPNGCGKSTLIKTLGGLHDPLKGKVFVLERELGTMDYSQRSRCINTVVTEKSYVDQITVEEVVALGRYAYSNWLGALSVTNREFIHNSIIEVGLKGFESRMLSTLSDGERQRVFIAKALASHAPVLLLDEPTAHLDVSNRVEILSLLRTLSYRPGQACLVSTHDLDLALQLADQIWLMVRGEGILCMTPEELIREEFLDKVFGNKTLTFDSESGSFAIRNKSEYKIVFKEENHIPSHAIKAFERLGFSTDRNIEPSISVEMNTEGWSVSSQNINMHQLTLTELCRVLKRLSLRKTNNN